MKSRLLMPLALLIGLSGMLVMLGFFVRTPDVAHAAGVLTVCTLGPPTCQYDSIQAAVDAANSGDVIKVAGGTYTGINVRGGLAQVVYISKTVTIRGGYTTAFVEPPDPDANPTTLDAGGEGRVIYITGAVSPKLEHLRITGGDASGLGGGRSGLYDGAGGGIYVVTATATLHKNAIFANTASRLGLGSGGGVYLWATSATLTNNDIYSNTASEAIGQSGEGGGLFLGFSPATLKYNRIDKNGASKAENSSGRGGGVYLWGSVATLMGNDISGNVASDAVGQSGEGGGLYVDFSPSTVMRNNIYSNIASEAMSSSGKGGGVFMRDSDAVLIGNSIQKNIANSGTIDGAGVCGYGGGILVESGQAELHNNIISDNAASSVWRGSGGGIWLVDDHSVLTNNVVIHNSSGITPDSFGAGVVTEAYSQAVFSHTTIHSNKGGDGTGVYASLYSSIALTNTILVSQSIGVLVDVGGFVGLNGVLWFDNGINITGTGGSVANGEVWGNPRFDSDDYHLRWLSAARNAGVDSGVASDIDEQKRPYGLGVDLGADELALAWASLDPLTGGRVVYSSDGGMTITVQVPSGAVSNLTTLTCAAIDKSTKPIPPDLLFAGRAFSLEAYQGSKLLEGFAFQRPVELLVHYRDEDVVGINEISLKLYYWDNNSEIWMDGAETCSPASTYTRDLVNNTLILPICHLSRWDLHGASQGAGVSIYLPIVQRD